MQFFAADQIFDGRKFRGAGVVGCRAGRIVGIELGVIQSKNAITHRLPTGYILSPGYVDVQVNGGGGVLFNDQPDQEGIRCIASAHRQLGTTSILPTLITDTHQVIATAIETVREAMKADSPGIRGIHLEGPFLNPDKAGAHRRDLIGTFTLADTDRLCTLGATGVTLLTVAPECLPAGSIAILRASGARVAAGHSDATADQISVAIGEGLNGFTHLFNAMRQMTSREPGVVGAALADRQTMSGLIVDGLHVDPRLLKIAIAARGLDGFFLVSDSMPVAGTNHQSFQLQGRLVKRQGGCLLAEDGTLSGADLDMATAVRNAVRLLGLTFEEGLTLATSQPARFIGLGNEIGHISPGAHAEMIALTPELAVAEVFTPH